MRKILMSLTLHVGKREPNYHSRSDGNPQIDTLLLSIQLRLFQSLKLGLNIDKFTFEDQILIGSQ
jgi:hypothetical protein